MQRKWMVAIAAMFSVSALAAGISFAADDEGPLHELMEKVNAKSNVIKKATRSPVNFKKAQASNEIVTAADELIKLSKEAKDLAKEAAKKAKNVKEPEKQWDELADHFTKELEKFHAVAAKKGTDQAAAKKAFTAVSASCTKCHNVFRVEEDSF